ncbi:hypothetical protein ABZ567_16640 [Streptomyces sp. NPDC016459]|uniref:hypothetical protein n=1 Tax=Streptomyces sp. NPDC016459 TaxID=3157190 RepID=UPI0033FD0705
MRPISRTALGAAIAAVLAVTAVGPSAVNEPRDEVTLPRRATAKTPYVYNLAFTETRPVRADRNYRMRAAQLGRTDSTYGSAGIATGFADAMGGDATHHAEPGSPRDIGNVRFGHDGELLGENSWPFGVFEVPAEAGTYTLEQNTMKIGSEVWARSTSVNSMWEFTSKVDESVYSQGIPILFPRYDLPEDGLKTLAATDGQHIGLTATGHAGYIPAALTSAKLSYSYDGGTTWTEARVFQQGGHWTAAVNHAGATGEPVTLQTRLTDANGNSVTQTVVRAYDVR